ncbi:MAG TPA: hypothetical protein PLX03_13590, partial [Candidatus Hydrogenedentes bacterium]|nr:hypothetical protein [Candidatus Hydrogenedentota bacterium]
LAGARAEIEQLRGELAAMEERLKQAEEKAAGEQKRVHDLERDKAEAEKRLESTLKDLAKAKESQEAAEKRAENAERTREESQIRISTLEAELSKRDQTISELDKRVEQAEETAGRVKDAEAEADRLRQEIASIRAALEDAKKQCAEITAAREQLEIDLSESRRTVEAERAEKERVTAELNQLQEKLRQDGAYAGLMEALQKVTAELNNARSENERIRKELEELRAARESTVTIRDEQGLRELIDSMPEDRRRNFGEVLVAARLITGTQLENALQTLRADAGAGSLPQLLVERQQVSETDMVTVMEAFHGCPRESLQARQPDPAACRLVPEDMARRYLVVPLSVEGDALTVAMFDPGNLTALDTLQQVTGHRIVPVVATLSDIRQALD